MAVPGSTRIVFGVAVVLLIVVGLALPRWFRVDDSLDRVRQRSELRVGYAIEPPYVLLRQDGTPGGESPEVAREVARRLGVRVSWVLTDFDQLIPGLEAGRFDMIAAGLFITPARQQRVRYSRPTLRVRPGWLRRAGSSAPLGTYAEAGRRSDLRLVVLRGSVEAALLESVSPRAASVLVVPDARAGREAVATGRGDGLALSLPTVSYMASQSAGRLVAEPADGPDVKPDLVALAFRPADAALARAADATLQEYLRSPEHMALLRTLGLGEADLPRATDAAD